MKGYLSDLEMDSAEAIGIVTETLSDLPGSAEGRGRVVGILYPLISHITMTARNVIALSGEVMAEYADPLDRNTVELNRLMSATLNIGDSVSFVIAIGEMLAILDKTKRQAQLMEIVRLDNSKMRRKEGDE